METKKELQQTAGRLAERYEDIKDKQEELARRWTIISKIIFSLFLGREGRTSICVKVHTEGVGGFIFHDAYKVSQIFCRKSPLK